MDYKQMLHFVRVYEHRSFSKAAEALFISQQGLSRSIQRLEESLRAPLFHRDSGGVSPTEAGRYLYPRARQLLELSDQAREGIGELQREQAQRLRMCASYGVMRRLKPLMPDAFAQAHPGIRLVLTEYPDVRGEEAIQNGECDVGFTSGPLNSDAFDGRMMFCERLCAVVHQEHALARRLDIGFEDLAGMPIYIMNRQFHTYGKFLTRCEKAGFTPNIAYEAMDMNVMFQAAHADRGVGIVNAYLARTMATPDMRALPLRDVTFLWDIYLIWNKQRGLTRSGALLLEFLQQHLQT